MYEALDSSRTQIRRLVLLPGSHDDSIHGGLETVSVEDSPHYEALSYIWGQEQAEAPLILDGKDMKITKNLDSPLRHIRLQDSSRTQWIGPRSDSCTDISRSTDS